MTRKDFIVIADMIAELSCHGKLDATDEKVQDIVDSWLRTTNLNYQSSRFWSRVEKNK